MRKFLPLLLACLFAFLFAAALAVGMVGMMKEPVADGSEIDIARTTLLHIITQLEYIADTSNDPKIRQDAIQAIERCRRVLDPPEHSVYSVADNLEAIAHIQRLLKPGSLKRASLPPLHAAQPPQPHRDRR